MKPVLLIREEKVELQPGAFYAAVESIINAANVKRMCFAASDALQLGFVIFPLSIYRKMEELKCQESQ